MNRTACKLLSLVGFVLTYGLSALASQEDRKLNSSSHPARILQVELVRNALIHAIETNQELQRFVDLDSLRRELPYEIDLYFPEAWPGLSISPMTRPYAKLGDWELHFGPDYDDPKNKDSAFFLRRIIYRRVKYLPNNEAADEEYTQVVLEPAGTDPIGLWEQGRLTTMVIEGWYVERFRLKNRGEYSKGHGLEYIAAGGERSELANHVIDDASITHIAFRGRVEHLIAKRKK